jgi:hypothetical protein
VHWLPSDGQEVVDAGGGARKLCKELKRCCYCREAVYCGQDCVLAHAEWHAEMHAVRFVFFKKRQLQFNNPVDFTSLPLY